MKSSRLILGGIRVLLSGFLAVFFLSACQSGPQTYVSAFTTPGGIKVETLMPPDASMVFKFGTQDSNQIKNLDQIVKKFPSEDWQTFHDQLAAQMDKAMSDSAPSLADIESVFGTHLQAMMAVSGKFSESESPDIVIAAPVLDKGKAAALLDKLSAADFHKQMYKTTTIYVDTGNQNHLALYGDVFIFTNRIALMQKAIDGADTGKDTLLQNPLYQKGLSKIGDPLGFFYFDVQRYLAAAGSVSGDTSTTQVADNSIYKRFKAYISGVWPEEQGFRVKISVYSDEIQPEESGLNSLSMQSEPAYLYSKVSGKDVIFYGEGYNLKKLIEAESEILKKNNITSFDQITAGINSLLTGTGIDAEKDLPAFTDKGYAVLAADNGSAIPSVTFFTDANSNPERAKKVLEAIYGSIEKAIQSVDPEVKKIFSHDKREDSGAISYGLNVDLKAMMNSGADSSAVNDTPISASFTYGIDAGNLFYIGLNYGGPGIAQMPAQNTLDKDAEFIRVRSMIPGYDRGVLFFATGSALKYLDRIIENTAKNGAMSEADKAAYEKVKKYIVPIKSMIFGNVKPNADSSEAQGFIRIE